MIFLKKNKLYTLVILLIYFLIGSNYLNAKEDNIKSIMIGHLYPIMENKRILSDLFNRIKNLNPDFIFILGDSHLTDPKLVNNWKKEFNDKVFFLPGNNEIIDGNLNIYKKNIGYLQKRIETKYVNFILINSNDNIKNINKFIKNNLNKNKYNFLLSHHRIWDDTLTSARPYQHNKSYYFKEIYPNIKKEVHSIFSGDSKHQYFLDRVENEGNQNMNNIFWVDRVGDINCYSIGTGLGKPKLGFIEVISNKKYPTIIIPHHISTDLYDPLPIYSLSINPKSIIPNKKYLKESNSLYYKINEKYKKTRPYFSRLFYILIGFCLFKIRMIIFKNKK